MKQLTFLDICAGIGGFRLGLESAGHKCIGYCEYDKFARASYEAMYETDGEWKAEDVTKLEPGDVPYADAWCFGFPCFEAGTLVMTEHGHKRIEDIKKGDMVLTHRQRFRPVVTPMKHKAGEIYELDIFGVDRLRATGEHPFLVKDGDSSVWKKAEELVPGDLIAVPLNREERLPEWNGIAFERRGRAYHLNGLDMANPDFWWFVGCYMGDGWYRVTARKGATDNYRAVVACNEEKLERLESHVSGIFHYSVVKEQTVWKAHFVNKELTVFLMQFGKGAGGKRLTDVVLDLPVDLLRAFLQGYFETDGCRVGKYYQASTISRELAYGIQACVHKAYRRPCAVYRNEMPETCVISGRTVRQHDLYIVRRSGQKKTALFSGTGISGAVSTAAGKSRLTVMSITWRWKMTTHTQHTALPSTTARISPSQESREGLVEREVESITASLTLSKAKKKAISPHIYLLRTLRTCFQLMEASILPPFSLKWTKQGMTCAGRCSTPRISESPRTGSGYSLLQFLEAEADGKYYLSPEKTEELLKRL